MKRILLSICLLVEFMLSGCPKDNNESKMAGDDVRIFDAKLIEISNPQEDAKNEGRHINEGWGDFMICKYQVINSTHEDVKKGTFYAMILTKNDMAKPLFTKTVIGSNVAFEKDVRHRVTISTNLPKGWESIQKEFSDDRLGFLACLKVESVNK